MSDDRRRYHDQRYVHFVTFAVTRRRRLLDLDQPKRLVLGVLNHQRAAVDARCVGLMPNHVHALFWLPQPQDLTRLLLTRFLHARKRMSSYRIRQWYTQKAANYFAGVGPGERFWQPKPYVFHIHSEARPREKLDMHLNPVRAGLVAWPDDWR